MNRVALIVLDFQSCYEKDAPPSILDRVLGLAEAADVVIATQTVIPGEKKRTARLNPLIKEEADYVTTRGDIVGCSSFSAFQSRTLRPLQTLEEILKEEKVNTVWVTGLGKVWDVPQTAFDANALGYPATIWEQGTYELSDYTRKRLKRAGVTIS